MIKIFLIIIKIIASNYLYKSVEDKERSFSNVLSNVTNKNLVFPDGNTIEKLPFNIGCQDNSISSSTTPSLGSDQKFYLTSSYEATDDYWLELITGADTVTYPDILTAFNFISNITVKVGADIIHDKMDGRALVKYISMINGFDDQIMTFLQTLGPTGAQTTSKRILIPLPILANQCKFNSSALHNSEVQKNLAIWPHYNKKIEVTISLRASGAIVSSGTATISAANLIFKSYSYNEKYNPLLPYYYISNRLVSDNWTLSLTTSETTQSISSIIKYGEINCFLVSFVTSTNMSVFDYNQCLKTSITNLTLRIAGIDIVVYDDSLSVKDSDLREIREFGKLAELTPQSSTEPYFIIPTSLLSREISNVGSSGLNCDNEKSIDLKVTASGSVTYNMHVTAVYKEVIEVKNISNNNEIKNIKVNTSL